METIRNHINFFVGIIILLLLIIVGSVVFAKGVGSVGQEEVVLRAAQSKASNHPVSQGIDKFAELVDEKSNGKIEVKTYHDGLLGDDREVIESAQKGSIAFASSSTPNMTSFTNYFNAWDLPYIFEDKEEVYKAIDGEPGDIIRNEMEKSGFKVIFFPDYGFRQIVSNDKPIENPEDLKGMKIRTTNSKIEQGDFEAFDASPTPVDWSEVYTALQQGTVEGEGNSYSLLWDSKHQEVLKHVAEVNYNYSSDMLIMNGDMFDDLTKEQQKIIMEAGDEAMDWQRDVANEREEEAKQQFVDFGIDIYEPDSEELKEWKKATEPVWDEYVTPKYADPEYVEIILDTLGKDKEDIFED